jgi:hypothetical protein
MKSVRFFEVEFPYIANSSSVQTTYIYVVACCSKGVGHEIADMHG